MTKTKAQRRKELLEKLAAITPMDYARQGAQCFMPLVREAQELVKVRTSDPTKGKDDNSDVFDTTHEGGINE